MIVEKSKEMISKSLAKSTYNFKEIQWKDIRSEEFGIYVHVPFCFSFCDYCPYYKEIYQEDKKSAYLEALVSEIDLRQFAGTAKWLYFGGGTPNTLNADDIGLILETFHRKVVLTDVGMEGTPNLFTLEYLDEIIKQGVNKISIGVETFNEEVLYRHGRRDKNRADLQRIISHAQNLGIMVNVDMLIGLPGQTSQDSIMDIEKLTEIGPNQITTYPYMMIKSVRSGRGLSSVEQFETIEKMHSSLEKHSYRRDSVWVSVRDGPIYDSSKDELVGDYLGFGPGAFSTQGSLKIVNPELDVYLKMIETGRWFAFVSETSDLANSWRRFSRQIYGLKFEPSLSQTLPFPIRLFLSLLKLTGYIEKENFTDKGRYLAHEITRTVVESLPFPLQNPSCVENYEQYSLHEGGENFDSHSLGDNDGRMRVDGLPSFEK